MGAQPRRARARLPQHGDRRRARAARRGRSRADLGQRRAAQLHVGVGHRVLAAHRLLVAARDAARVGQPGPDDLLLPRRRARGQARARPRRAARAPAPGAARGRRHRRRRRRDHRLPGHQRGRSGCARLGHGHVDRHRVRARHPRLDRAPGRAPARVPALARRGRRPRSRWSSWRWATRRTSRSRPWWSRWCCTRPSCCCASSPSPRASRWRSCSRSGCGSPCSSRASTRWCRGSPSGSR